MSDPSSSSSLPKAISSLAKKPSDITRQGTAKLKFTPVLPARRKKEDEPQTTSNPVALQDRGRGRGRGEARGGRGRGAPPRAPPEMTASGPFALGPAMVGSGARKVVPRTNVITGASNASLGSSLSGSSTPIPHVKKEEKHLLSDNVVEDEEYSDPDDGVEIIDIEHVKRLDSMAPDSLPKDRTRRQPQTEIASLDLKADELPSNSESISHNFAQPGDDAMDSTSQDDLFIFQFPSPFPTFLSASQPLEHNVTPAPAPTATAKKVSFAPELTPTNDNSGPATVQTADCLDGTIGQLEIFSSGTVKMRFDNGIVLDVTHAVQPSFTQYAVSLDMNEKQLTLLGEVNKRFVVSPDIDALLADFTSSNPPSHSV